MSKAENYISPTARIMSRVKQERLARKLSGDAMLTLINESEHIGRIAPSTYRSLECNYGVSAAVLTQAHVRAMADALDIPTTDIATSEEFNSLKPLPKNRKQWPAYELVRRNTTREELERFSPFLVTSPKMTAARIKAYQKQHAYTNVDLIAVLKKRGGYVGVNDRTLGQMYFGDANALSKITPEFLNALAIVFSTRDERFDPRWLIQCQDHCPHCYEGYLSY